jgi:hypothetical protein
MMQLPPQIRERLHVGRLGPERAGDALAWNGAAARVEDQEGDELLLPRARGTRGRVAIEGDPETPKRLIRSGAGPATLQEYTPRQRVPITR